MDLYNEVDAAYKVFLRSSIEVRRSFGIEAKVSDAIEDVENMALEALEGVEAAAKSMDAMTGRQ